jgi:4-hydroxy-tetrahydrodipicolinate reductase
MKIALIGYGKMGHMIEEIALQRGHEIVCKIDVNNPEDIDSPEFCSADVAIEFTNPTAAYGNYLKAFSHNVKVVSGSTGWMKDHKEDVEKLCADGKQTLFWASNFSIGVAIFSAVNRYLAKIMNGFPQYSVCMQETHHVHKLDAPSGTAITLYSAVIPVRPLHVTLHVDQRHGVLGERHGERSFRNARSVAYLAHEEIVAREETLFER